VRAPEAEIAGRSGEWKMEIRMAGDWIPIACDIHAKPETVRIAAALRRSTDEVVGMLVRFWAWAQSQSSDGTLEGLDIVMAAAACHVSTKFLESLASVGWLVQTDHGLVIPNFDRWMGNSAKARLRGALRKQRERLRTRCSAAAEAVTQMSRSRHASVTQMSRSQRDTSVTIEEKRIEEKSLNNISPNGDSASAYAEAPCHAGETLPSSLTDDNVDDSPDCHSHRPDPASSVAIRLRDAWNAVRGVVPIREWSERRKRQLRARLRDPTWLENAIRAIAMIPDSPFLLGENDRGWRADIDWFLRPDSVTRILEGKYRKKEVKKKNIFGLEVH